MTSTEIQIKIDALNTEKDSANVALSQVTGKISALNADIIALMQSRGSWLASISQCPGLKSSSKYKDCASYKTQQAESAAAQIPPKQAEIDALTSQKSSLESRISAISNTEIPNLLEQQRQVISSEIHVSAELAGKGLSKDALDIVATGTADASRITAKETAAAQSQAILTDAEASSANKKKFGLIGGIIGGVVIIILIVVVVRKIRKKS